MSLVILVSEDTIAQRVVKQVTCGRLRMGHALIQSPEVKQLMGKPRAVKRTLISNIWSYGKYWVHFSAGIVTCVSIDDYYCR